MEKMEQTLPVFQSKIWKPNKFWRYDDPLEVSIVTSIPREKLVNPVLKKNNMHSNSMNDIDSYVIWLKFKMAYRKMLVVFG